VPLTPPPPAPAPPPGDGPALGEAYTYIPFTVLGDYSFETEPNWLSLEQRSGEELWAGLQARNWTSKHFE
jgi:hypothetical protein